MGAVLHRERLAARELEVRFVDERRRAQRLAGPEAADVAVGERPQVVVDGGKGLVARGRVASAPGLQELRQREHGPRT